MATDIHILNNCYTETTKERDPTEEWDGEDRITSNNIVGFEIVSKTDKYKTVDTVVAFEIEPGKNYHLVSVEHSSGDSFNNNSGEIVYIELYDNLEMAERTQMMIEDDYKKKNKEESYSVEIVGNEGDIRKISSSSWVGYFERLECVRIDSIQLKS